MTKLLTGNKLLIILAALSIPLIIYFIWNRPHRDIKNEETSIRITADSLFAAYSANEQSANKLYLDKAVEVKGKVAEVKTNSENKTVIILQTADPMFGVNCTMEQAGTSVKSGDEVEIKGICTGFLSDVVLNRCYLKK